MACEGLQEGKKGIARFSSIFSVAKYLCLRQPFLVLQSCDFSVYRGLSPTAQTGLQSDIATLAVLQKEGEICKKYLLQKRGLL